MRTEVPEAGVEFAGGEKDADELLFVWQVAYGLIDGVHHQKGVVLKSLRLLQIFDFIDITELIKEIAYLVVCHK